MQGSNSYPNGGLDLRARLAQEFNLKTANVIAGSGSDGIMANIIRTFLCDDDEVLTTESAFIGFQVLARSRGVRYRTVPYRDWHYDLPALAAEITGRTKIIYLANPNNPTGTIFTKQEFDEFYRHVPARVLIILDEAYFEYARSDPRYPDSMHYRYDNVITLRTFSKIYGLAGVRIGYGFAHDELIANLLKVKLPFEPGSLAQAAGIAALDDKDFVLRSLELNQRGLRFMTDSLREMGLNVVPSHANFVMVPLGSPGEAKSVFERLLTRGVIVRPLGAFGLPHCLRISIGTSEENQLFLEAFQEEGNMPQIAEYTTPAATDFLPLQGTDYLEFYVGNARQAAHYYRSAFGMHWIGYSGPETGSRDRSSYVLEQGKIRFILTTALRPDDPIAQHVQQHGDGVRDIALTVDDAAAAYRETTRRGARGVREPFSLRDDAGEVRMASIATYGDTVHTFVERSNYRGAFLPGFVSVESFGHRRRARLDCATSTTSSATSAGIR